MLGWAGLWAGLMLGCRLELGWNWAAGPGLGWDHVDMGLGCTDGSVDASIWQAQAGCIIFCSA